MIQLWFFNFLCFITKYGFHLESSELRNVAFPAPFFPLPQVIFGIAFPAIGLSKPPDL